jgi:hypothetical protein
MSASRLKIVAAAAVAAAAVTAVAVTSSSSADAVRAPGIETPVAAPVLTVYKSPTCGCCKDWITHVQRAGFRVDVKEMDNMSTVKADAGIPASVQSCHTTIVDGYAIEGHVPADVIQRLLKERPKVAGIAVPGMPVGAPGMEVPGRPADKYDVVTFDRKGKTGVFASR